MLYQNKQLVQHLLTERLFRNVFDNPEFTRRSVIAAEIEKVIAALTSQSFSREAYLKQLDYFYVAIENTARTITDFSEKQGFLNTIYERFFRTSARRPPTRTALSTRRSRLWTSCAPRSRGCWKPSSARRCPPKA